MMSNYRAQHMNPRSAAIVPVAGLSSRMGDFKPTKLLNGFPMIRMTVQSLLDAGVSEICLVLGREPNRVRKALDRMGSLNGSGTSYLQKPRIHFVQNEDFANTDMLHSIKLGLTSLLSHEREHEHEDERDGAQIERIFILPGDIPSVSPHAIRQIGAGVQSGRNLEVAVPTYKDLSGHPLCMNKECVDTILRFEGDGGLKAALETANWTKIEVTDRAVLLDADTPDAFEELAQYVRNAKGVSATIVNEFLYHHKTFPHIRDHCRAVGQMSARMCAHLNILGYALDTELARSAAALHDMNRLHEIHSREAARNLRTEGYLAVARAVSLHDAFFGIYPRTFTESAIICTADKLLKETTLVSLNARYKKVLTQWTEYTKIGRRIRMDRDICQAVVDKYEKVTGDLIYIKDAR